jgi:hypothetical protein
MVAEWIGHLISSWPFWVVIAVASIAGLIWIATETVWYGGLSPFEKKEWWQDRQKRLEKQRAKANVKMKKG